MEEIKLKIPREIFPREEEHQLTVAGARGRESSKNQGNCENEKSGPYCKISNHNTNDY